MSHTVDRSSEEEREIVYKELERVGGTATVDELYVGFDDSKTEAILHDMMNQDVVSHNAEREWYITEQGAY